MTGIAIAMTRTVKSDVFLHVQEQLGELPGLSAAHRGRDPDGGAQGRADRPRRATARLCAAAGAALPPAEDVRAHGAGDAGAGCRRPADQSRREADLRSEIGPDIARYYRGAGVDADKRIQLSKLAWDATGTQFGQRMLQYERYYAGDPVRVGASYYLDHDVAPLLAQVAAGAEADRSWAMNGASPRGLPKRARAGQRGERRVRHLFVLLAGAGSDADAADDVAVDDDRQAARQVDALALRGDGELEVDAGRDIAGRDRHRRRRSSPSSARCRSDCEKAPSMRRERQQMAAAIDDGDALRHAHLLRLRHRGIEQLHCAVRCQLQRRQRYLP